MDPRALLNILQLTARLKDTPRHCTTKNGRLESVAEHCWMLTLLAYFVKEEFPEANMEKVMHMCLIHDLGEAFTGDIPVFEKTAADEKNEEACLQRWVDGLPAPFAEEMTALYAEMAARETLEAKIFKALDGLEALIQHNLSDLSTWLPLEYDLQKTYALDRVQFSDFLKALRQEVLQDTLDKIATGE